MHQSQIWAAPIWYQSRISIAGEMFVLPGIPSCHFSPSHRILYTISHNQPNPNHSPPHPNPPPNTISASPQPKTQNPSPISHLTDTYPPPSRTTPKTHLPFPSTHTSSTKPSASNPSKPYSTHRESPVHRTLTYPHRNHSHVETLPSRKINRRRRENEETETETYLKPNEQLHYNIGSRQQPFATPSPTNSTVIISSIANSI